jgi:membrane-associated phospholipid phosphatase
MLDRIWLILSFLGDYPFWIFASFAIIGIRLFAKKKRFRKVRWLYTHLLPSVAISTAAAYILKMFFKDPRICIGSSLCPATYGFPSMHSAAAFAFSVAALVYFRKSLGNSFKKDIEMLVALSLLLLLSFLITYSRLVLGFHTPDEVIAGSFLGIACSVVWCLVYEDIIEKRKI